MRRIDEEAHMKRQLLKKLDEQLRDHGWQEVTGDVALRLVKDIVKAMPETYEPVEDAIDNQLIEDPHIIRCLDCIQEEYRHHEHYCYRLSQTVPEDFWCRYGKRREPDEYTKED